jgi:molecular chaperone DnaK
MIRDAEKFAQEDQKRKAMVEKINEVESIIHLTTDAMKKLNLSDEETKSTEEKIQKVKLAIEKQDVELLQQEFEGLKKIQGDLSTRVYQKK